MPPLFELCLENVAAAKTAEVAGVKRIELCAALAIGGITPSLGCIQACRDAVDIDIMVMIRPRGGDFLYDNSSLDTMARDIELCRKIGVQGVVLGLLTTDGAVDLKNTQMLMDEAGDLSITFHRAFDVCRDPFASMEQLIDLGVNRILTSGQARTAIHGRDLIKRLIALSDGRIGILPGCGITANNLAELIRHTAATEFHATAAALEESSMNFRNPNVYMGIPGLAEYERKITKLEKIQHFLAAANNC